MENSPKLSSTLRDALAGALLLAVFLLPAYLFLPSLLAPLVSTARAVLSSLLFLLGGSLVILLALGVALTAEKAYRRWVRGERPPPPADDGVAVAGEGAGADAERRARRFTRESRMDAAAERVIERLEQSSVGRLVRRKVKGGKAETGDVELKELRRGAATTGVRREPPPLPPR
ncbi:hypothetical protein JCM10449v2_003818 [Rhodotorula kratochvilovae]